MIFSDVFPDSKILAAFKQFELIYHSIMEGLSSGLHKSPYKGFAIEFAEHRQYYPGDDIKHIDWKLVGKLEKYYIKQYEEDTSLHACILLDASGSMEYSTAKYSKLDYAKFIAGVMSYILIQQKDSVSFISFDTETKKQIPPGSSRKHFRKIMETLAETRSGGETNLGKVLHRLADSMKKRAFIILISDFFDNPEEIDLALSHFSSKKYEVAVFQVLDKNEIEFNFSAPTRFLYMESDDAIFTEPQKIRKEYLKEFEKHGRSLRRNCHKMRIDFNRFIPSSPFEKTMADYLAERMKK